jgi:two-component system LytT family sensor kinase
VARLQLDVLRAQLHPHFLFNTLHTISAMMHEDVRSADRMLARLSELLRMVLNGVDKQEVRLAEELALVHTYLQIERVRFGERLETRIEAHEETLDAFVPALFLQPLVENCLRHGLVPQRPDSLIVISARREGEELVLRVADNGRGLTGRVLREGVGVANTRKRLDHLYPRRSSFRMEPGTPSGWVVTARLPYRIAAVAERCERVLA